MSPKKKATIALALGIGIALQILRLVLVSQNTLSPHKGLLLYALGTLFFIWGCMNYAGGKGFSKWLGLLGLLSIIGLAVLVFLPDRYKQQE